MLARFAGYAHDDRDAHPLDDRRLHASRLALFGRRFHDQPGHVIPGGGAGRNAHGEGNRLARPGRQRDLGGRHAYPSPYASAFLFRARKGGATADRGDPVRGVQPERDRFGAGVDDERHIVDLLASLPRVAEVRRIVAG